MTDPARLRCALDELRADAEAKLLDAEEALQLAERGQKGHAARLAREDADAFKAHLAVLDLAERALDAEAGEREHAPT